MNKEEIEESKQCLNETIQNTYAERKAIKLDNLRKYIQHLEQKESILDKVTDKLKEDAEIFKKENVDGALQNYVAKILKIIEGEKK